MTLERIAGDGWLALLGGGEFSFGQTEEVDRAWLAKVPEGETIGFLPTASGSKEYGGHFAGYLQETFDRQVATIPIYRARDSKRTKNHRRIAECGAVYLGGGVVDHLFDAFMDTPALESLVEKIRRGGVVIAIAGAAEALGSVAESLLRRELTGGFDWLRENGPRGGAVVCNFDPRDERRLRERIEHPAVSWVLGIPANSAVLLGPRGEEEILGNVFFLNNADAEIATL